MPILRAIKTNVPAVTAIRTIVIGATRREGTAGSASSGTANGSTLTGSGGEDVWSTSSGTGRGGRAPEGPDPSWVGGTRPMVGTEPRGLRSLGPLDRCGSVIPLCFCLRALLRALLRRERGTAVNGPPWASSTLSIT